MQKFDVEVVERGTEFELEFVCIIRNGDNQSELKRTFFCTSTWIQRRRNPTWGTHRPWLWKRSSGILEVTRFADERRTACMAWLSGDVWSTNQGKKKLPPNPLTTDQRTFFRIEADFRLRTSLLIRSTSADPKDPDMTHLHSNGKPVIPGTSFAGAFRQRAALIANALKWKTHKNDEDPVCELFGPIHKQDNKNQQTKQTDLWASRVTIEEHLVENVKPQWQDRVAIDRFTGGSLQSALFNEKPVYPCPIKTDL